MNKRWFCVQRTNKGLWTALLYEGEDEIDELGGSYPKSMSTVRDAQRKWGIYEYKLLPSVYKRKEDKAGVELEIIE